MCRLRSGCEWDVEVAGVDIRGEEFVPFGLCGKSEGLVVGLKMQGLVVVEWT